MFRKAIKNGYINQIKWGNYWEKKAKIFNSYVDNLYTERLKYPKSNPLNKLYKDMYCLLFGKTIQKLCIEKTLLNRLYLPESIDLIS